jgi:hypothetical protein
VLGRGSQGGCFCCGHGRVYCYLTSNCRPGLTASRQPRRCERAHKGLACPVPVFRGGYLGGGDPA